MKIPYMLVIGDREEEEGTVSIRRRDSEKLVSMKAEDFVAMIKEEIETREK